MMYGLLLLLSATFSQTVESDSERLWRAAKDGDLEALRALIQAGVDVNARTEFEATALYFAAANDHAEACALLADAGADLDVADNSYGNTPIGMAAWLGFAGPVEVLIEKGSTQAIGAMFAAASNGHQEVVKVVLAKVDLPPGTLQQVYQAAVGAGQPEMAAFLVEAGATPDPSAFATPAPAAATGTDHMEPTVEDAYVPVVEPAPWPAFRGAGRSGVADGQHPPRLFDAVSGTNVRWSVEVPGLGHSSPVVWGNRVFITTAVGERPHSGTDQGDRGWIGVADENYVHSFEVHCFELASGIPLWSKVCRKSVPRVQRHWKASFANCTCAVDGETVIAFFGGDGLYALDLEGEVLWEKDLGELNAAWFMDDSFPWGYASSPILWEGTVFVQCDTADQQFVACLDALSGEEIWRTERDELSTWGTPLLVEGPSQPELILGATRAICSYDPDTGDELWRVRGNSKITVASPIAADGHAIVTGGYQTPAPIYVVRLGANGDLTLPRNQKSSDDILWSSQRDGVYQLTPLVYNGRLYMPNESGIVACYELETGKRLYRERVSAGVGYTASPVAADGFLYLTDESGQVHVLRDGPRYERVAVNDLGERAFATPAISNGMMVFRTQSRLLGIAHDRGSSGSR